VSRKGYRLDRDGNRVPPDAPSISKCVAVATPRRDGGYDDLRESRMAPPKVLNVPLWFFQNKPDRISKPMPVRTALDIMGIAYKE
jgi:hypothetical protein